MAPPRAARHDLTTCPIGYVLAGEEHDAAALIRHGIAAEKVGFGFLFVSDHFHPWLHEQGHSPAVWPILGALAQATEEIELVSAVCCPVVRWHPTALAQSAATVSSLSGGRFTLGLGTGELLNEHVTGLEFPSYVERAERLAEAVGQIRALLSGEEVTSRGHYFTTHRAQLFDPAPDLPIAIAASGPSSARLAGSHGDGLIGLAGDTEVVETFEKSGGRGKPKRTQLSVCWGADQLEAERLAHRLWPVVALEGTRFANLRTPAEVEAACSEVTIEHVAAAIVCGPDPERYHEMIQNCLEAGYDGVALHQVGSDQSGFFEFYQRELLPRYST